MAYATADDLTTYTAPGSVPAGAADLLGRASRLVDAMLIGAVYGVDDDGAPTDPDVVAALRDATCEQALYLQAGGDPTGHTLGFQSASVGGVSYTRGAGAGPGVAGLYSPVAIGILRTAGLAPVVVR